MQQYHRFWTNLFCDELDERLSRRPNTRHYRILLQRTTPQSKMDDSQRTHQPAATLITGRLMWRSRAPHHIRRTTTVAHRRGSAESAVPFVEIIRMPYISQAIISTGSAPVFNLFQSVLNHVYTGLTPIFNKIALEVNRFYTQLTPVLHRSWLLNRFETGF